MVWFPRDLFFPPFFSSFSFFGSILCVLKTFCSDELCTSYSWQLRSHLWSWMRSLVHILFYLCLWSGFLWFFLRLCFYWKDIQPTISKKEKEVKFILSIWHCLFRHMDKLDYVPLNVFFQYANNLCFSAVITVKSSTIRWLQHSWSNSAQQFCNLAIVFVIKDSNRSSKDMDCDIARE